MCLYIMDPILGQLVAWYSLDAGNEKSSLRFWLTSVFRIMLIFIFTLNFLVLCNAKKTSGVV